MDNKYFDFFFHEIASITGVMKQSATHLLEAFNDNKSIDKQLIKAHAGNLLGRVELIEMYIKIVTLMNNPEYYQNSRPRIIDLHEAFTRFGRIMRLKHTKEKKSVEIETISGINLKPLIDVFAIAPFIVLDNAFKYSAIGEEIQVVFSQVGSNKLNIEVTSCGPYVEEAELPLLTNYKYRGVNAGISQVSGHGLGLYFLKEICEISSVELSIHSRKLGYQLNGVDYGLFTVIFRI